MKTLGSLFVVIGKFLAGLAVSGVVGAIAGFGVGSLLGAGLAGAMLGFVVGLLVFTIVLNSRALSGRAKPYRNPEHPDNSSYYAAGSGFVGGFGDGGGRGCGGDGGGGVC